MNTLKNIRFNSPEDLCDWVNDYAVGISRFKIIAIIYDDKYLLERYVLFYNENV